MISLRREVAVTVAFRSASLSTPTSPKTSPGPRSTMCSPPRATSTVPSSIASSALEKSPSRMISALSLNSTDSANAPSLFSSSAAASEKSGICLS
jgi:hypothetical protein